MLNGWSCLAWLLVTLAACGGHEVCAPYQARGLGKAQALRGEPLEPTLGGRCDGGSRSHVEAGYREGKQELCNPAQTHREGWTLGTSGAGSYGLPPRFRGCANASVMAQQFDAGYVQGIRQYCDGTAAGAYQTGRSQGAYGQPRIPLPLPPMCAQDQVQRSVAEYERGYGEGLVLFCSDNVANARGLDDGRSGRGAADMKLLFAACSSGDSGRMAKQYNVGYKQGLAGHCATARVAAAAEAAARDGADRSSLPFEFAVCPARTGADYDAAFAKARDRYMADQCTVERGVQIGRADARLTNEKRLAMPSYCDREKFKLYQRGYADGWKEVKASLCSEIVATDQGVQDARGGRPLSYAAPALCPANLHGKLLAAYRSGHKSVPRPQTPTVVVVAAPPPPPPASNVLTWKSDATNHRGQFGARLTFVCPPGTPQLVWGSDVYSDDSSLCSAAVHAGAITSGGGTITIELRPGLTSYRGSERYGVASKNYGRWDASFVVLGASTQTSDATRACMEAGYTEIACRNVTSATCIRKGYSPTSCRLPTTHLAAIEVCLDSGYAPSSCKDVTIAACIRRGYGPASCQLPTRYASAVEACLDAGYMPSSCREVVDVGCIRRGNSPLVCTKQGGGGHAGGGQTGGGHAGGVSQGNAGDDDDDDDNDDDNSTSGAQALYERCVKWADERYRRGLGPVEARDRANANCRKIRDLEVAEYIFEVGSKARSAGDAMDFALEAGRRSLGRKLELLKYVVDKYSRSMSAFDAAKRGLDGVEKLSAKAKSCVESNYDSYSRGLSGGDAMDRALEQCRK